VLNNMALRYIFCMRRIISLSCLRYMPNFKTKILKYCFHILNSNNLLIYLVGKNLVLHRTCIIRILCCIIIIFHVILYDLQLLVLIHLGDPSMTLVISKESWTNDYRFVTPRSGKLEEG